MTFTGRWSACTTGHLPAVMPNRGPRHDDQHQRAGQPGGDQHQPARPRIRAAPPGHAIDRAAWNAQFVRHGIGLLPQGAEAPHRSPGVRRAARSAHLLDGHHAHHARGRSGSPPPSQPPAPAAPGSPPAGRAAGSATWRRPCLGSTAYESRPPSHREKTRFGAVRVASAAASTVRGQVASRRISASSGSAARLSRHLGPAPPRRARRR